MLVDRAGPSSTAPGHHHHHHHHHNPHQQQSQSQSQQQQQQRLQSSPPQKLRPPPCSPTSSSFASRPIASPPNSTAGTSAAPTLKVVFTPPPKYAETQIKQALCHELHKFGKTYHITLLPASATGGRQTRIALVVFRRAEDEERAFLAFRNATKSLFGSSVHVEYLSGAGESQILFSWFSTLILLLLHLV